MAVSRNPVGHMLGGGCVLRLTSAFADQQSVTVLDDAVSAEVRESASRVHYFR
jgi:hypothetical protein